MQRVSSDIDGSNAEGVDLLTTLLWPLHVWATTVYQVVRKLGSEGPMQRASSVTGASACIQYGVRCIILVCLTIMPLMSSDASLEYPSSLCRGYQPAAKA